MKSRCEYVSELYLNLKRDPRRVKSLRLALPVDTNLIVVLHNDQRETTLLKVQPGLVFWAICFDKDNHQNRYQLHDRYRSNHLLKMSASMGALCLGVKRNSETSSGECSKGSQSPISPGYRFTQTHINTRDTHRQIHTDIRAVQQQHPAGDGGPRRPGRRDVNHRPPADHGGCMHDLLLMGQEQGVPGHPSCPPSSSPLTVPLRLRERRLNVRRRKPIIFLIHKVRRSLLCPGKVFHTTGGEAGVLLLLLSPPPPPRPPRGEESLSRHGGDFRAADQSSGWMSAGDPSRIPY
ncbi:hypothetical protein F7725_018496 [Dissostichus mawsoni]|uniref:Uncharacterized protein n=1 Tax=Dissostichus mawsoni TaxID=36200 RepID=A0A7J5XT95_DISMA|nr:hypothetical protein F7725_018496 [Dissostichus mawsoni]